MVRQVGAHRPGEVLGYIGALVGAVLLLVGPHVTVQVPGLTEPGGEGLESCISEGFGCRMSSVVSTLRSAALLTLVPEMADCTTVGFLAAVNPDVLG